MTHPIPAQQASYVVLDTETTGFRPDKGARVLEVAAVRIDNGQITDTFTSLVNPGDDVDLGATDIHRITRDMLTDAPTFTDISASLARIMNGAIVVCHNTVFDLPFLKAEFAGAGVDWPEPASMCTLSGARFLMPGLASYKLVELAAHLGIDLQGAHAALADATATAHLHLHLLGLVQGLSVPDPGRVTYPAGDLYHAGKARSLAA